MTAEEQSLLEIEQGAKIYVEVRGNDGSLYDVGITRTTAEELIKRSNGTLEARLVGIYTYIGASYIS